jgi:excisionase family DNA binding protein
MGKKRPEAETAPPVSPETEPENPPEDKEKILDMEQAIALLKTTRPTFYRWLRAGKFKGMKVGRQWRFYKKDIEAFLQGEGPRIALPSNITPLLDDLTAKYRELGGDTVEPPGKDDLERVVRLTVATAIRMRASDVHLHPHGDGKAVLRVRVDGVLHTVASFPLRLLPAIIEQWKALTSADVNEKRQPQDGRALLTLNGSRLDVRTCFMPTALGESMTARIFQRDAISLGMDQLRFPPDVKETIRKNAEAPTGLVVVTGPTGSGKTTTLYSCLVHINRPAVKIMTVEDPVELLLEGIVQTNVSEDAGITFAVGLKYIFRNDPDVVMVGEVRDTETLEMCGKAAVTGHLVLTSLHVPDAVGALVRMRDMVDDPRMLVLKDVLRLVLAQRLLRVLCDDCAESCEPSEDLLEEAEMAACMGGLDWAEVPREFRKAVGCPKCADTGYRGRTGVAEALEIKPAILDAVCGGLPPDELQRLAVEQGMTTMAAHAVQLAGQGVTSLEEVSRVLL